MTELNFPVFNKPVKHIEMIVDEVYPYSEHKKKSGVLTYAYNKKSVCYILLEGQASLHRRSDGVILYTEHAPAIIFTSNMYMQDNELFYLRTGECSQVSFLTQERFDLIVERSNLWESLSNLLAYQMSMICRFSLYISQIPIRDAILLQLQQLMKEDTKVRKNITAANYIMNRTSISRSSIMRNISHLKNNKTITLDRGILIKINNDNSMTD